MTTLLDHPDTETSDSPPASSPRFRVRKSRVILVLIAALVTVVAAVWLLSWWSPVPIREVVVEGASVETAEVIRTAAAIPTGTALRDLDAGAITAAVNAIPGVDSVSLELQRPWTVVIDVRERFPFGVTPSGEEWIVLDETGHSIKTVAKRPKGLPQLPAETEPFQALAPTLQTIATMDPDLAAKVDSVSVDDAQVIQLTLRNGAVVDWGRSQFDESKVVALQALLPLRASRYTVSSPQRPAISGDAKLPKPNRKPAAADTNSE